MITVLLLFALVGAPVFLALLLAKEFLPVIRRGAGLHLEVGDPIVYRKQKVSTHPTPRAYEVHPAGQGDTYSYFVDKFWTVENVLNDGRILVTTRTRKQHCLRADDPNLRKAGLAARLLHGKRFPRVA
ncbi:MAG: hypothetical protein WDN28_10115 [Chthoniobacter sp.]